MNTLFRNTAKWIKAMLVARKSFTPCNFFVMVWVGKQTFWYSLHSGKNRESGILALLFFVFGASGFLDDRASCSLRERVHQGRCVP